MRHLVVTMFITALLWPATASATVTTKGHADKDPLTEVKLGFRRIEQRDPKVNQIHVDNALYTCNDGNTFRSGFQHIHGQLNLDRSFRYRGHFGRNRQDKIRGKVTHIGRPGQGLITVGRISSLKIGPNNSICRTSFRYSAIG
jgi:hypothetical protein